jgi:hypothetical protein
MSRSPLKPEPPSIRPPHDYMSWLECVVHLHTELERLVRPSPHNRSIKPYLAEILSDIQRAANDDAGVMLFDYWRYDQAKIAKRARRIATWYGGAPSRPRIDVSMVITSRGNFAVTWDPRGLGGKDCDWVQWESTPHRHQSFDTRPSNELLFIRGLGRAVHHVEKSPVHDFYTDDDKTVETILLQATLDLIVDLKRLLEINFDVRMVDDVFEERERGLFTSWRIENVAERTKRLANAELDGFESNHGVSIEEFAAALVAAGLPKKHGDPQVSPGLKDRRASAALKKAGHKAMTEAKVTRYRQLLERLRPELLGGSRVVPFVRPPGKPKKR